MDHAQMATVVNLELHNRARGESLRPYIPPGVLTSLAVDVTAMS